MLQAYIDVSSEDLFLTTSWWTTWSAVQSVPHDRIYYLLQEDERMFYPEGDEKLRCQQLMSNSAIHIVVNSHLLYRHLILDGFSNIERQELWFEPSIVDSGAGRLEASEDSKRKNFLFYARPGHGRNLFYLGLEAIEKGVIDGLLDPADWKFFFVGRDLPRIISTDDVSPTLIKTLNGPNTET